MSSVVANQCSLILRNGNLRNFSAFEEKVDVVLRDVCGSDWFQSFAEKVRKIRVLVKVGMCVSDMKFTVSESLAKSGATWT